MSLSVLTERGDSVLRLMIRVLSVLETVPTCVTEPSPAPPQYPSLYDVSADCLFRCDDTRSRILGQKDTVGGCGGAETINQGNTIACAGARGDG